MTKPTLPGRTILIVDDNPVNLGVVVAHLEESGFDVAVALGGEEALERAAFLGPDLILLDVMMPGIDGFETCRRLKAGARTAGIPVIFMTALTDVGDKVAAFEAGGVDYVSKPFQAEELLARVKTHLQLRAAQQQLAARNEMLKREMRARLETEEALAESESRYRRLFETSTDGILLLDSGSEAVTDANPAIAKMLGTARDGLIGRRLADLPGFASVDACPSVVADVSRAGHVKFGDWSLDRDHSKPLHVEVIGSAYSNVGQQLVQLNFRDVRDRKGAEAIRDGCPACAGDAAQAH